MSYLKFSGVLADFGVLVKNLRRFSAVLGVILVYSRFSAVFGVILKFLRGN